MDHSKQSLFLLGVITFATLWAPIKTQIITELTTPEYDYNTEAEEQMDIVSIVDTKVTTAIPSVIAQPSQETSEKTTVGTEQVRSAMTQETSEKTTVGSEQVRSAMTQETSEKTSANTEQMGSPTIRMIAAHMDSAKTTSKAEHPTVSIAKDQNGSFFDNAANPQSTKSKQETFICLIIIGALTIICTLLLVTTTVLCHRVHILTKNQKKPQTRSNGDFMKSSKLWSTGPHALVAMPMEEGGTSATSEEVTPLKNVEEGEKNETSGNTAKVENGTD
eukprot:gi/632965419/ref/XP_007898881.1/ PREDICTED: protein EVI2A [Callorhinchus milii]